MAHPGKGENSWSVSADGRVHPDVEGSASFPGFSGGSVIQVQQPQGQPKLN